jgi:predicted nuclease of predicted toxin-antitoxin system
MKLLVDMNLSPAWVDFLILAGVEAVHWSTVGPVNAADQKIMEYAVQLGFVVLTHDLDFSAILAWISHTSEVHRGTESEKVVLQQTLGSDAENSRCKQTV